MIEDDNTEKGWDWKKYEPVLHEWVAQCVRNDEDKSISDEGKPYSLHDLTEDWRQDQEDKGAFPSKEEIDRYQIQYEDQVMRLYKEVEAEFREGRLKNGREHLSRRSIRYATQHLDCVSAEELMKMSPADFDQKLRQRVRNAIVHAREERELKTLRQRRRRCR